MDGVEAVPARTYTLNQVLTLEAVPAEGYAFDHWTGDVNLTENPDTLLMSCSKVVTAYFASGGEVSGLVWLDESADGVKDTGEPGMTGVVVNLYSGPQVVRSTVSGVDGAYLFMDTEPGDYRLRFVPPVDYLFSPAGLNSQANYDGFTAQVTVAAGSHIMANAGLYPIQESTFTVPLAAGWNLRALPCSLTGDQSCTSVLCGLTPDELSALFAYRYGGEEAPAWCSFRPDGPASLSELLAYEGYWFLMQAPADLLLDGTPMPPFPTDTAGYYLHEGWNLTGFCGPVPRTVDDYFGPIAGAVVVVYGYEDDTYYTLTGTDLLQPGAAYWVALSVPGTVYPFVQIGDDIIAPAANAMIIANDNDPAFVILDVRSPAEFAAGHIAGAININYYDTDFSEQLAALDRHGFYFIYCGSGFRSRKAVDIMIGLGFQNMYNLSNGIQAWTSEGFPLSS